MSTTSKGPQWNTMGSCPPVDVKEYVAVSIDICPWQNPMRSLLAHMVASIEVIGAPQFNVNGWATSH